MSRFACDEYDPQFPNQGELWWANIERHIKGRKGQEVLREIREILLAMPEKRLIKGRLADERGQVCVVGAISLARRCAKGEARSDVLDNLARQIPEDDDYDGADITASEGTRVGLKYGLAWALGDLNDETLWRSTPEERYDGVLAWIEKRIASEAVAV